jgi:hypothetical protein
MRLVRVAAAAAAGLAVLAGCGGGETANETLPSTSSSAAETSASLPPLGPPDLPMPAEAREQTPAGAEAFLHYYVALMNYAQEQSRSDFIRSLSVNCSTCSSFGDGIDNYASLSYHFTGGSIALNSASAPLVKGATAEFAVSLTQDALQVINGNGDVVSGSDAAAATYPASGATLTWDSTRATWVMSDLTIA